MVTCPAIDTVVGHRSHEQIKPKKMALPVGRRQDKAGRAEPDSKGYPRKLQARGRCLLSEEMGKRTGMHSYCSSPWPAVRRIQTGWGPCDIATRGSH